MTCSVPLNPRDPDCFTFLSIILLCFKIARRRGDYVAPGAKYCNTFGETVTRAASGPIEYTNLQRHCL